MTKDRREGGIEIHKTGRRAEDIIADPMDVLEAIENLKQQLGDYVKDDTAWKLASQPAIDNMKNLSNSGMLIVKISLGVTAIGGAIIMLFKVLSLRH